MKKLLSILTISTLTAGVPAPLLANTILKRAKIDAGSTNKEITDGLQIKIKNSDKWWIKILNPLNEINPNEKCWYLIILKGINIDWDKNIYHSNYLRWDFTNKRLDFPKNTPIREGTTSISLDKTKTQYFIYKWVKNWDNYIPKQPIIDKNANIIDWNIDVSPFQKGISFLIADDKNGYWLRPYELITNGQIKIKMANSNIKTVKVNCKEMMPQKNKVWEFDLPTYIDSSNVIENKNYEIEISFMLDEKSYTGQIIISSLLYQPKLSFNIKKNTSAIGNIDSYVYQVPTNDKVGDIALTSDLYYSDTKVKINLNESIFDTTFINVMLIVGLDEKWEKTHKYKNIEINNKEAHILDSGELGSYKGRYLIETRDSAKNENSYYIVINKDNLTPAFWDTKQGQTFYSWANLNGYNENIKKLNATNLNTIIEDSTNWQQLATDSQFAIALAEWFKINGKLSSSKEPLTKEQVVAQLKTQIPNIITIDGKNTILYDPIEVMFELNQSEFKPNDDKANIIVKYKNAKADSFNLQIKNSNIPNNNKKGGLTRWVIFGIIIGSLLGLFILEWLFKKFVITPFILEPIRKKKAKAFAEKTEKDIAQMKKDNEEWEAKQKGDK